MNILSLTSWEELENLNQTRCQQDNHQFGRTSDGYEKAKLFFESSQHQDELDLAEALDIFRQIHRMAPFLFLNGNTLAYLGKQLTDRCVSQLLTAQQRSIIGHHIAGTEIISVNELRTILPKTDHLNIEDRKLVQEAQQTLTDYEQNKISFESLLKNFTEKDAQTLTPEKIELTLYELKAYSKERLSREEFIRNLNKRLS